MPCSCGCVEGQCGWAQVAWVCREEAGGVSATEAGKVGQARL